METNLRQRLGTDLKQAVRDRDDIRRSVIRLVMSAIHNNEIAKRADLDDPDIIGILTKEAKQRKESIEAFRQGNRPDLVAREEAELKLLEEYLPETISRDEIIATAKKIIAEVGAEGPHDKGKVMSKIIPLLKGQADGKEINSIVTELLGS